MSEQADPGRSSPVRRATTIVLPPIIKAVMKRDWHGREHIPRDGGVIIAPNHLSYADWAAVALFTYEAGRYPFFLIKSSAFDVRLLGPFLRACGQLPVHRDRGDASLVVRELKDAEASLRAGRCCAPPPPRSWPTSPACLRSCGARSPRPCRSTPSPPAAPRRSRTARRSHP